MATYAATKAFVRSFSEALWEENRPYGIKVMALCPGVTETGFFEASHMKRPPGRIVQTSAEVVDVALRALKRGKSSVISGWPNRIAVETERVVPRSLILRVIGAFMRPYIEKG
jgi:short-subunit dehydrogenase